MSQSALTYMPAAAPAEALHGTTALCGSDISRVGEFQHLSQQGRIQLVSHNMD